MRTPINKIFVDSALGKDGKYYYISSFFDKAQILIDPNNRKFTKEFFKLFLGYDGKLLKL